jgi:SAM-dependent methyltransferase
MTAAHTPPAAAAAVADREALEAEIRRLGPWHHDVEIAPGLSTGNAAASERYPETFGTPTLINPQLNLETLLQDVVPEGFAGRSFLDCACNAGGYVFAAKRLGAGRCFGFDARDHWITQARFLMQHIRPEDVSFAQSRLEEVPALQLQPFDITYFSGILYHLPDPINGLRIAADLTKELIVVNTASFPGDGTSLVLNRESVLPVMSGVDGLAWLPNGDRVVRDLLAWCGFPHSRLRFRRVLSGRRIRLEVLGARNAETFAHFDATRGEEAPVAGPGRLRRTLRRLVSRI